MDTATLSFLYLLFLTLHNLTRWLVVVFAVLVVFGSFRGWFQKLEWIKRDDRAGILFTSMVDLQVLWGLVLYFLFSPTTPQVVANFSGAMKDPTARFFGFEHVLVMVVGLVLAHIGRALAQSRRRARKIPHCGCLVHDFNPDDFSAIPWPFVNVARPWLRLFGVTI